MLVSILWLFVIITLVYGRTQVFKDGNPYAILDANRPITVAYNDGSFKYPFNVPDWYDNIVSKGLNIDVSELERIYRKIGDSIRGGHASLTTYVKPDNITNIAGDYVYGAWKVQVIVDNYVWKYKIAQGERSISCKQKWKKKVTTEFKFIFKVTTDVDWYYWTDGTACTFQIVSPLINNVIKEIDDDWNRRYITHSEL